MSHTPGPWKVIQDQYGVVEFIWGDTGCVCDLRSPRETAEVFDGWMGPTKPANARLIAAAPELYEALVDLLGFLFHGKKDRQAILRAKAALAKARGDEGEGEGFDEAEYRRLLEAQKANKLSPQEEERLVQLYEEGEVDDIPSVFLRPEVEQKMDSLIEKIGELIQGLKARGDEGDENA